MRFLLWAQWEVLGCPVIAGALQVIRAPIQVWEPLPQLIMAELQEGLEG